MPLPCDTDLTHLLFHTQKHPEKHTDSMDDTGSPLTVIMLRNIAVGVLFLILRQQGRISVISTSAYLQNCSVVKDMSLWKVLSAKSTALQKAPVVKLV